MMGEYTLPADFKAKISVTVDPEAKTLTFTDNGLGMTGGRSRGIHLPDRIFRRDRFHPEVQGQIHDDQIIGHFGLGFYPLSW